MRRPAQAISATAYHNPTESSDLRFVQQLIRKEGTVLISKFPLLGGPSFSSAIQVGLYCGLQPLKLQGLKPLIRRRFSSGLRSRPPIEPRHGNAFQIRAVPKGAENCMAEGCWTARCPSRV